jgi:cytochrome c peroxidase
MSDEHHPADGNHHPHVVPMKLLTGVIVALFVLTFLTVAASWIDLGAMNVPLALFIAAIKGTLVAAFFMHLRWDKPFNSIILILSIGFLALFLGIATMDTSENQPTFDTEYAKEAMDLQRAALAAKARKDKGLTGSDLDVLYPQDHAAAEPTPGAGADPRAAEFQKAMLNFFKPLPKVIESPADNPATPEKVALGKSLYFDARLSKSGKISCNSCHGLGTGGVDNQPTSPGHGGARGDRNSPTVLNAGLFATQFWDGRAANLEEQAKGPILNPVEMAMADEAAVIAVLKGIAGYAPLFKAAFPGEADPITYDNLAKAIAAFERTLVTPSPLDAFLGGDLNALNAAQLDGFDAFREAGCVTCHKGVLIGDGFEKLGKVIEYPDLKDKGREAATNSAADRGMFKVPTLRNVAQTGPYFHDGSIKTLDEAITLMAKHQVGKDLDAPTVAKIKTFLESMTGTLPPATAAAPAPVK